MTTFLSILRGINVSGQKKILMKDLKTLYEELKFKNVTTYIQSGNVIFESSSSKNPAKKIEQKIVERYSFNVPVIMRTVDEIQTVLKKNPFLKERNIDVEKLHVTFLTDIPKKELIDNIEGINYEPDKFILSGKEIYLYCPHGYGITKLNNNFFEHKLKTTATTRNWRTVNELFKIMKSDR
jgi:uncharacterized protein (DUF1697 family)